MNGQVPGVNPVKVDAPQQLRQEANCPHNDYRNVKNNQANANGSQIFYEGWYVCEKCGKTLAAYKESISETTYEVLDEQWAETHNIN